VKEKKPVQEQIGGVMGNHIPEIISCTALVISAVIEVLNFLRH